MSMPIACAVILILKLALGALCSLREKIWPPVRSWRTHPRQGINRLAKAYLDAFIVSYAKPTSVTLLDINHSEK